VVIPANIISDLEWTQLRLYLGLSVKQAEIVKRVLYGKPTGEIARDLAIPARTVRTKIEQLYREFGLTNRYELVVYVLKSLRECSGEGGRSFLSPRWNHLEAAPRLWREKEESR
jgi:DNA-binding CsgD family transcriptional regulator